MDKINALLDEIYQGDFPVAARERLLSYTQAARDSARLPRKPHWDQQDVVLITYADQFREPEQPTLASLTRFFQQHLQSTFNIVHLLPFFPWSSDDGFSVIDYHAVNPACGGWQHIAALHSNTRLMFDFVCNHISAQSAWFRHYLAQDPGWDDFFISQPPATDLSTVTRPRTSPLLTPFKLPDGDTRFIWTTFSADQVDLNFASPEVLIRMTGVLIDYLKKGADYVRLDAVGYLWKTPGTRSIHLHKTHLLVKLFRAIADVVAPGTVIVTETNVPHRDNISYFGNGDDEAQMVYQFSLPPLVLHAIHTGSARVLHQWADTLTPGHGTTTFFNFLASHDGIGLNPARGLLTESEIGELVAVLAQEGARISYKNNPDGTISPYEINVTYLDALSQRSDSDDTRLRRFLLAHAILLAFPGVPAIYIQSILGSRNDDEGANAAGYPRAINRKKYSLHEIEQEISGGDWLRQQIFTRLSALIQLRTRQPAFHPDNPMTLLASESRLLLFRRHVPESSEEVLCLFNLSSSEITTTLPEAHYCQDLVSGQRLAGSKPVTLAAWQFMWLRR